MFYLTHKKEMLGFSLLKSYPDIFHFTTSRQGGFSQANYASMNGSYYSGDRKELVDKNWNHLRSYFPSEPKQIIIPYQTHGDCIACIDEAFLALSPEAQKEKLHGVDALISQEREVLLTIATADCVPISLYDPVKQAVGVVHAGWRGTVSQLLSKTVQLMFSTFGCQAKDLLCCIGPSISLAAFEVGDEVVEAFRTAHFDLEELAWWNKQTQKYHLDLWKANKRLLLDLGVLEQHISCAQICTYHRHQEFFSARRLGISSGRIITGIQLNGKG
ncbi:MAG: peptidoglycan editing factor PgeF [Bacteroides sp.]